MTINVRIRRGATVVVTEDLILEVLKLREAGEEINVDVGVDANVVVAEDEA